MTYGDLYQVYGKVAMVRILLDTGFPVSVIEIRDAILRDCEVLTVELAELNFRGDVEFMAFSVDCDAQFPEEFAQRLKQIAHLADQLLRRRFAIN